MLVEFSDVAARRQSRTSFNRQHAWSSEDISSAHINYNDLSLLYCCGVSPFVSQRCSGAALARLDVVAALSVCSCFLRRSLRSSFPWPGDPARGQLPLSAERNNNPSGDRSCAFRLNVDRVGSTQNGIALDPRLCEMLVGDPVDSTFGSLSSRVKHRSAASCFAVATQGARRRAALNAQRMRPGAIGVIAAECVCAVGNRQMEPSASSAIGASRPRPVDL